jgi:hypothetical protein
MKPKLAMAVLLFASAPMCAHAQQNNSAGPPPKPTAADVQKLVQTIGGDKTKLKAYCDMGKVLARLDQAEQKKDSNTVKTLGAKADSLAEQLGPDYERVMDGLNQVDPNSAEGKRMSVLFEPIYRQCR